MFNFFKILLFVIRPVHVKVAFCGDILFYRKAYLSLQHSDLHKPSFHPVKNVHEKKRK